MNRSIGAVSTGVLAAAALAALTPNASAAAPEFNSVARIFQASKPVAEPPARPVAKASIMVKLEDASAAGAAAFADANDLTVVRRFPQISWVEFRAGKRVPLLLNALEDEKGVLDTDALAANEHFGPDFTPRDPVFTAGNFANTTTSYAWHLQKINAPAAWDLTRGSSGTRIGVIDSEFDTQNPDLTTKLATGYNTRSGSAEYHTTNVRTSDQDIQNAGGCGGVHGTHVAGIIAAATDNNKGVAGVSFDNLVYPIRSSFNFTTGGGATDSTFVADTTEAILYAADKGIVAINMSFGTPRPHDPLRDAIAFAVSKGVTMVGSAGNDQQSAQGQINYPAAYPGVIAVGATKPNDDIAAFSSQGDYVDIAAPGDPVMSTWDQRCGGAMAGQFGPQGQPDGVQANAISGTSMAAPVVTGVVGLMKSIRPDLSPAEVEQLLESSARDLGAGGKDPVYGFGLVDANKAVIAARDYQRPAPPATPAPPVTPIAPVVVQQPVVVKPAAVGKVLGNLTYNKKLGRLAARVECAVSCIGTAKATSRGKTLKSTSFSLKAGGKKTLLLKVSKTTLRKLAKGKKVGVALTITITGADGRKATIKKTISTKP